MSDPGRPGWRDSAVIAALESQFRENDGDEQDVQPDAESFGYARPPLWGRVQWSGRVHDLVRGEDLGSTHWVSEVIESSGTASHAPIRVQVSSGKTLAALQRLTRARIEANRLEESAVEPSWLERVEDQSERVRVEIDIRYVMARLERIYTRRQAKIWMDSFNQWLDAKPVDYLIYRSVADVIRAVEAAEQQAY